MKMSEEPSAAHEKEARLIKKGAVVMAKASAEVEEAQNVQAEDTEDNDNQPKDDLAALRELAPGTRVQVMVTMPVELKIKLMEEADKAGEGMTLARFVRETLASDFEVELPNVIRTRRSKYESEEEREAAQKAKSKKRNALIKKLLAAYKAGDIDLEDLEDDDDDE